MTQTLPTRDPNDEHARLIEQTLRLSLGAGEPTQPIRPYDQWAPSLRSADATEVIPVVGEGTVLVPDYDGSLTEEILGYDPGPYPPVPVPIPPTQAPKVAWNDRFAELPTVRPARPDQTAVIYQPDLIPRMRPDDYRARHRRAPRWTRVVLGFGLYLLGIVSGASAMVAWVVAQ